MRHRLLGAHVKCPYRAKIKPPLEGWLLTKNKGNREYRIQKEITHMKRILKIGMDVHTTNYTCLCQVIIGTFFIFLYNIRFPLHFLNMQLNGHLPSKTRSRLVSTVTVLGSKTPRLPQGCAFSLGSKRLRQVFNVKYRRFQTVFSGNSPSNCFSFL